MSRFRQTKDVPWLDTPKGTIWVHTGFENFIQPEDISLRSSTFGVNLDLLYVEDFMLFAPIPKDDGSNRD